MEKSNYGSTAGFATVKSSPNNPPSPSIPIRIALVSADANPDQLHRLSTHQHAVPIASDQGARGYKSQIDRDQSGEDRANGLERTYPDR
jgi:hypothetical protein